MVRRFLVRPNTETELEGWNPGTLKPAVGLQSLGSIWVLIKTHIIDA
jgi:hypothetical protein